jgi:uncharacterized protein YqkB
VTAVAAVAAFESNISGEESFADSSCGGCINNNGEGFTWQRRLYIIKQEQQQQQQVIIAISAIPVYVLEANDIFYSDEFRYKISTIQMNLYDILIDRSRLFLLLFIIY